MPISDPFKSGGQIGGGGIVDPFKASAPSSSPASGGADLSGMVSAATRGLVAGAAGAPMSALELPGDIYAATRSTLPSQIGGGPTAPPYTVPGSTRSMLGWLPGEESGKEHPIAQGAGLVAGTVIGGAGAIKGAMEAPRVASDIWLGGTARATANATKDVGEVSTPSDLGNNLQSGLWGKIGNMNAGQRVQAMSALSKNGISFSKLDKLPEQVFSTKASVQLVKNLTSPSFVDGIANDYAASALDKIGSSTKGNYAPWSKARNIADSVEQWQKSNSDWLSEVPGTNSAVSSYVQYLRRTAATQKAGTALGTAALFMAGHGSARDVAQYVMP